MKHKTDTMNDLNQVPAYLRTSSLFKTLVDKRDQDLSHIAPNQFKRDLTFNSLADASHLLNTLQHWKSSALPMSFICFCLRHENKDEVNDVLAPFAKDLAQIYQLHTVLNTPPNDRAVVAARIGSGHNLLQAVHLIFDCELTENVTLEAAGNGRLACLKYAHRNGCPWHTDACTAAAGSGHIECLKYAHEHGCPWDTQTCDAAAGGGHLACLQYAHEHGCPWTSETCWEAIMKGEFKCLRYAQKHGCPLGESCTTAASNGDLKCLKFSHEHGGTWDSTTCQEAAGSGSLECLQYAHTHGCPWDSKTCAEAAESDNLVCLQYAHEHGCPWDVQTLNQAAYFGNLECLKYALSHGCTWQTSELLDSISDLIDALKEQDVNDESKVRRQSTLVFLFQMYLSRQEEPAHKRARTHLQAYSEFAAGPING